MIKELLLTAALLMPTCAMSETPTDTIRGGNGIARDVDRAKRKIDNLLDLRDSRGRKRVDTAWLQHTPQRLRLKATVNGSGSNLDVRGMTESGEFRSQLEARNKYTMSLSASYRGLTLGFAVNPAHLAGKNKDYEFNMNAYGNRMGADIIFQSANTFEGSVQSPSGVTDIPAGLVRQNMLTVNAYYALNSRRFSYPAAFSQSWIQRRSCGSVMLGVSFMGGNIKVGRSDAIGNSESRLSMMCAGIGVGYGYNIVLKDKWLIHLSTLPEFVVFNRSRMTTDGQREKTPYRFPNLIVVGRLAVVRHFDRYFAGMTAVVNTSNIGDREQLELSNTKWRARFFFGIKL